MNDNMEEERKIIMKMNERWNMKKKMNGSNQWTIVWKKIIGEDNNENSNE